MKKYRKAIIAIMGLGAVMHGPDAMAGFDPNEVLQAVIALFAAFGVYQIPNEEA